MKVFTALAIVGALVVAALLLTSCGADNGTSQPSGVEIDIDHHHSKTKTKRPSVRPAPKLPPRKAPARSGRK
ncbi:MULTISPECIES: hypothetical protein [unclassified Streptomyces]|uniref:hypothetical protein n=1 Tax=unclassified Streptomyces TaxID=2593676 RepID=UPI003405E2C8